MSISVNRVNLLGNIGNDVEIKFTQGGTKVANFSLATNERYKGKSGEFVTRTEWHRLVAFGRTAEIIESYTAKGSKVYVDGSLRTRSWEDKETGKKQYRTEIVVDKVSLLDGSRNADAAAIDANDFAHAS